MNPRAFADRSGTGARTVEALVNMHWRKTGGEPEKLRQNYSRTLAATADRRQIDGRTTEVCEESWRWASANGRKRRLLSLDGQPRNQPLEPAMPDHPAGHEPELLTITEAAELLRAPVATLRYWRHRNIGPRSFRFGRRVLYRRSDLQA